jgi:hypothetical protein
MKEKWTLIQRINENEECVLHSFDSFQECFKALHDKRMDFEQFGYNEADTELSDTLESIMFREVYNDDGTIELSEPWCEPVRRTFEEYLEHKELEKLRALFASKKRKK